MDKSWIPKSVRATSFIKLIAFGMKKYLSFEKPVKRRNQIDHVNDCYFCLSKIRKAIYPDVKSIKVALHCS